MKILLSIIILCFSLSIKSQQTDYLEINQVRALISNYNTMHWDLFGDGDARYQVPKGTSINTAPSSNFASAFWIGGLDVANQLHLAAQTYRQAGDDFWAGPLDTINASTNLSTINQFNRVWKLNKSDIDAFITNYANGTVASGSYTPVSDLLTWPANSNGNISKKLAPYVDVNQNGIYDPVNGGDYPKIKGDQAIYYIFNDNGGVHQNTGGQALGFEIHAMAYAYGPGPETSSFPQLAYTTFYNYRVINRSNMNYHNVYLSMWSDVDIGYYGDDFIGCNVSGNYGYAYNGDNLDDVLGSTVGYSNNPPAAGFQVLKGPYAQSNDGIDNDNNGIIDEFCEQNLMNKFTYFNNSFPGVPMNTIDPDNASQYYNYMTGYWKDGTPFSCGGNAFGGTTATPFAYPGNTYSTSPCGNTNWSDAGPPGDRRYILSSGPFNFDAKSEEEIEYAYVTSFDPGGNPVNKLKYDMNAIRVFSQNFDSFMPCKATVTNLKNTDNINAFNIYPNPVKDELFIRTSNGFISEIEICDVIGNTVIKQTTDKEYEHKFSTSNLANGIYIVKIKTEGQIHTQKIIKQ